MSERVGETRADLRIFLAGNIRLPGRAIEISVSIRIRFAKGSWRMAYRLSTIAA